MTTPTTPPPADEYGTVFRIHTNRPIYNYTLVLNTKPLHVRQYCRTLTLAQGRILYELWEEDDDPRLQRDPKCISYLVPSHLAEEARTLSTLPRSAEYAGKPAIIVRRYEEAWDVVVRYWPNIPVYGAKRVVERLVRLRVQVGRESVEEGVARYALRCWSGYKARLEAKWREGVDDGSVAYKRVEEGVRQECKGRVVEVLRGWMGEEARREEVFVRLGLVGVEEGKRYRGVWFD